MVMDALPLSISFAAIAAPGGGWASASAAFATSVALPAMGFGVTACQFLSACEKLWKLLGPEIWNLLEEANGDEVSVPDSNEDQAQTVQKLETVDKGQAADALETVSTLSSLSTLSASAPEWRPQPPPEVREVPSQAQWDAHLEDPSMHACHFRAEMTPPERRSALNLHGVKAAEFINRTEFVSIGCYCAPTYALQLLDLRKKSYPFDWTRSSLQGIVHCINVGFQDFLTYTERRCAEEHDVFLGTCWGGSFWHANLEDPRTHDDMRRRAQRFLGQGDVPAAAPRVFVRMVNSTHELGQAWHLRQQLKMALPRAQEVLLLLLVELQGERGPIVVTAPEGEGVIVFSFAEAEFHEVPAPGRHPLAICGERCCEAIAAAIRIWCGENVAVRTSDSFAQLSANIYHFDGGDPAWQLFAPRWVMPAEPLPRLLTSRGPDAQFQCGTSKPNFAHAGQSEAMRRQ